MHNASYAKLLICPLWVTFLLFCVGCGVLLGGRAFSPNDRFDEAEFKTLAVLPSDNLPVITNSDGRTSHRSLTEDSGKQNPDFLWWMAETLEAVLKKHATNIQVLDTDPIRRKFQGSVPVKIGDGDLAIFRAVGRKKAVDAGNGVPPALVSKNIGRTTFSPTPKFLEGLRKKDAERLYRETGADVVYVVLLSGLVQARGGATACVVGQLFHLPDGDSLGGTFLLKESDIGQSLGEFIKEMVEEVGLKLSELME